MYSVYSIDFTEFKQQSKFFDLRLLIKRGDEFYDPILIHKAFMCIKSKYINTFLENTPSSDWPPTHTLIIELPNNISYESFNVAIDYIYKIKHDNYPDAIGVVDALMFLLIDHKSLMKIYRKIVPIDRPLSEQHLHTILHLMDVYDKHSLIEFYGVELLDHIEGIDENSILFGRDMTSDQFKEVYEKRNHGRFSEKIPYISSVESEWVHLKSVTHKSYNFTALGIDWCVNRWMHSFSFGDNEDFVKLYVSEKCESTEKFNIRVTFIVYSEISRRMIEINHVNDFNPMEYKHSYMSRYHKSNKLGLALYDSGRVRISILIEKL